MKSKVSYIIGTICGSLTLTIGTGIFLIWWAARDWFAISLVDLEVYGFFWIMIATPIALVGLFLILFVIGNNYPKFYWKTILSVILLLANIPALYLILDKHSDLDQRAFFKLTNRSESKVELIISSSSFQKELGTLNLGESTVNNFYPKYLSDPRRSVPLIDTVSVLIKTTEQQYKSTFPSAYKGSCYHFILTKNYEVTWN